MIINRSIRTGGDCHELGAADWLLRIGRDIRARTQMAAHLRDCGADAKKQSATR